MKHDFIPDHVAIIMDGNGRWAKSKGLPRFHGHLAGIRSLEEVVKTAAQMGIKILTVYAFSTENWNRPPVEVNMLMKTFCSALDKKAPEMNKANIRIGFIGRRKGIPPEVIQMMEKSIQSTEKNTGLVLNVAFNYGARAEIIDAVQEIVKAVQSRQLEAQNIDENVVERALYTRDIPDPDFLIRTSGEQRISNFLLWQLSYTELYFTETLWPDFGEKEFKKAIADYQRRERRYGKVLTVKP